MHFLLKTPISSQTILSLHAGDMLQLCGEVITARDRAHQYLLQSSASLPFSLDGAVLYHCGPIVQQHDHQWSVIAAGPTTSSRLEPYTADIIEKYGVHMIVGKAGMGPKTLEGLRGRAVYCSAVGGAAQVLAHAIVKVKSVYKLEEFGIPEAFWVFEVKNFPVIVTMDAHGKSLHDAIQKRSAQEVLRKMRC